jgi:hypothetical protein
MCKAPVGCPSIRHMSFVRKTQGCHGDFSSAAWLKGMHSPGYRRLFGLAGASGTLYSAYANCISPIV